MNESPGNIRTSLFENNRITKRKQLDDRIQAGYAALETDPSAACEQWAKAWEDFLLLCDEGSFTSIAEFDEAFNGTQFVSNWTSDFEMELGNAASKDARWHERRAQFCEEFLHRFPREDELTRENMRRALGEATFGKGEHARGDDLFERWLADDPRWGWGWIGWSDCYFLLVRGAGRDLPRAEALLKRGLEIPEVRDREDLLERLAEICHEQGRAEEARQFQTGSDAARRAKAAPEEAAGSRVGPAINTAGALDKPKPARSQHIGRNEPCPCGSGKKYKKCCLPKDEENARQAAAEQLSKQQQPHARELSSMEDRGSGRVLEERLESSPLRETETQLPLVEETELDRLWNEFEAIARPTVIQMDEFLSRLLSLEPEATAWNDLFHRFSRLKHPDLAGVFRRIAAEVPHTRDSGMAFFYWAAAEEFTRQGTPNLLPEVAAGFRRLDIDSYDADALTHQEDFLLAAGLDAETLQLAEHFLPIERADDGLMSYAVPERCNLTYG